MAQVYKDKNRSPVNLVSRMEKSAVESLSDIKSIFARHRVSLNGRNKFGESPLMIACAKGSKDIVRFLLEQGANPNARSRNGNTPMHFAILNFKRGCGCLRQDGQFHHRIHDRCTNAHTRLAILRLLIKHGAILKNNSKGLDPPCLAAIHQRDDIVEFFVQRNRHNSRLQLSDAQKARVYEILAVALYFSCSNAEKQTEFLHKALSIRNAADGKTSVDLKRTELAASFSLFSTRKYVTHEDLNFMEYDHYNREIQYLMVAERVLPEEMLNSYLLPELVNHGYSTMFNLDRDKQMLSKGSEILREVLKWEVQSKLELGSVLRKILSTMSYETPVPWSESWRETFSLMDGYLKVFKEVEEHRLLNKCNGLTLIEELGMALFSVVTNLEIKSGYVYESLLQFSENMISIFRKRCGGDIPSVVWKILEDIDDLYEIEENHRVEENRVKHVISRILRYEDASQIIEGNSMLHCLVGPVGSVDDLRFVKDVAWLLIRHGCPVDACDLDGRTAKEVLRDKYYIYPDAPDNEELMALLSSPTSVLRLEEIAVRTILRHRVPHSGILPRHLSAMVSGVDIPPDLDLLDLNDKYDSSSDSSSVSEMSTSSDSESDSAKANGECCLQ